MDIWHYADTYKNKISPVFSNIEEEAKKIADEQYEEMGRYFNPDYHDAGDFAEQAWEKGLDYFEGMSLMGYNTKLMWCSTLYHFWEQQVRRFIYQEVNRTHRFIDKNKKEIPFEKFCVRGIDDIKEAFSDFNQNLEQLSSWEDINELRLLTNVIKHGAGWSATELEKLRPEFFNNAVLKINLLELYRNTLTNIVLSIQDEDFERYCNSLIKFWGELPERMYSVS